MSTAPGRGSDDKHANNFNAMKRAAPADDSDEEHPYQPMAPVNRMNSRVSSNSMRQRMQYHPGTSVINNPRLYKTSGSISGSDDQTQADEDYDTDQEEIEAASESEYDSEDLVMTDPPSQPAISRTSQYVDCSIRYPNAANPLASPTDALRIPEQFTADTIAGLNKPTYGSKIGVKSPAPLEVAWWYGMGSYFNADIPNQHLRIDALTNYLGWDNNTNQKRGYEKKKTALKNIYSAQTWKQHWDQHLQQLKDHRKDHSESTSVQLPQPQSSASAALPAFSSVPRQDIDLGLDHDLGAHGGLYGDQHMFADFTFPTESGRTNLADTTPLAGVALDPLFGPLFVQSDGYSQHRHHAHVGFAQAETYDAPSSIYGERTSTDFSDSVQAEPYTDDQQEAYLPLA